MEDHNPFNPNNNTSDNPGINNQQAHNNNQQQQNQLTAFRGHPFQLLLAGTALQFPPAVFPHLQQQHVQQHLQQHFQHQNLQQHAHSSNNNDQLNPQQLNVNQHHPPQQQGMSLPATAMANLQPQPLPLPPANLNNHHPNDHTDVDNNANELIDPEEMATAAATPAFPHVNNNLQDPTAPIPLRTQDNHHEAQDPSAAEEAAAATTAAAFLPQEDDHLLPAANTKTAASASVAPPEPVAAPAAAVPAPAKKRGRKSNTNSKKVDRKLVNGVRLRFCICSDSQCAKLMRRWATVGMVNNHQAGYVCLPIYKDSCSPTSHYTNTYLERCLVHLMGCTPQEALTTMRQHHAIKTGKQVRVKFLAWTHFHPRILDYLKLWHGKRNMHVHEKHAIPATLGKLLNLTQQDMCISYNPGQYFAVPNYALSQFIKDLEVQEQHTTKQQQLVKKVEAQDDKIAQLERQIQQLKQKRGSGGGGRKKQRRQNSTNAQQSSASLLDATKEEAAATKTQSTVAGFTPEEQKELEEAYESILVERDPETIVAATETEISNPKGRMQQRSSGNNKTLTLLGAAAAVLGESEHNAQDFDNSPSHEHEHAQATDGADGGESTIAAAEQQLNNEGDGAADPLPLLQPNHPHHTTTTAMTPIMAEAAAAFQAANQNVVDEDVFGFSSPVQPSMDATAAPTQQPQQHHL